MERRRKKAGILTLFLLGIIFTGAGAAVVQFMGHDVELTCDRAEDRCVIQKTDFRGETEVVESFPLSELNEARVEESRDSEGDYTYTLPRLRSSTSL